MIQLNLSRHYWKMICYHNSKFLMLLIWQTNNEVNLVLSNSKYSKNLKLFSSYNNLASIFWPFKDIFKFIKLFLISLNENNFTKK